MDMPAIDFSVSGEHSQSMVALEKPGLWGRPRFQLTFSSAFGSKVLAALL
jgi:hypothetical protein